MELIEINYRTPCKFKVGDIVRIRIDGKLGQTAFKVVGFGSKLIRIEGSWGNTYPVLPHELVKVENGTD